MLQRIQTVFLLLAGLVMITFLFVPIWEKDNASTGETYTMTAFYYEHLNSNSEPAEMEMTPYMYIGIGAVICAILAFLEISYYKKRMTQMKIGTLNALLMGIVMVITAWFASEKNTNVLPEIQNGYAIGIFLPGVALIFNAMANRFIRRDERLVRSVDRLR